MTEDQTVADTSVAMRRRKLIRAAFILLLALLCIFWAFMDHYRNMASSPEPDIRTKEASPGAASREVRVFFASGIPLARDAANLAARLTAATPEDQAAICRLYEYAAERNEPSAFAGYASCLDPSRELSGRSGKNAGLAARLYRRAAEADIPGALESLDAMSAWLREKAAGGDAMAKKYLKEIDS